MINRRALLALIALAVLASSLSGCAAQPATPAAPAAAAAPGSVKLNAHPASLEGKTVVLRWNSKPNGDKFLDRVAEQLTQQVKDVKIVKLWEIAPSTASISKSEADSAKLAELVAAQKADLVIASQAD